MKIYNDLRVASCRMGTVSLTEGGFILIELNRVMPTTSKMLHLRNIILQVMDPNSKPGFIIDTSKAPPVPPRRPFVDGCLSWGPLFPGSVCLQQRPEQNDQQAVH